MKSSTLAADQPHTAASLGEAVGGRPNGEEGGGGGRVASVSNGGGAGEAGTGSGRQKRKRAPALQVVCLGDSGGPSEENATAFLVRSVASEWAKGSLLAVDAGSHLAPITRIVERDFGAARKRVEAEEAEREHEDAKRNGLKTPGLSKDLARTSLSPAPGSPDSEDDEEPKPEPILLDEGPFAGLKLPHASGRANALHILQVYVSTYLITHPHMDHIAGFTINTAAFHTTSKPKTLAALPGTVDAMKRHVFNDVIWPNLSDEDGGVGFVTFQRLKEGGDPMLGEGEGRGYIDVCDGLSAKAFAVSHGTCTKTPPVHNHRGSIPTNPPNNTSFSLDPSLGASSETFIAPGMSRTTSLSQPHAHLSAPGTPNPTPRPSFYQPPVHPQQDPHASACVVDSTAYFLRDSATGREVLFFGDVEPDSISLSPRNHGIWAEAARKIAARMLSGVFIECSYDDAQADSYLFGHLAPRHLVAELLTLASLTREAKIHRAAEREANSSARKRKRSGANGIGGDLARVRDGEGDRKRSRSLASRVQREEAERRRSSLTDASMPDVGDAGTAPPSPASQAMFLPGSEADGSLSSLPDTPMSPLSVAQVANTSQAGPSPLNNKDARDLGGGGGGGGGGADRPLEGVKVVVIHVKDTFKDGPHVRERILAQLRGYEKALEGEGRGLGCEFVVCGSGESYWF